MTFFILVHFLAVWFACLLTLSTVLASQSFWFNKKSLSSNLELIFFLSFVFFFPSFFWFLFTYFLWLWHSILATPFTRLPTLIRVPVQVRVKGPAASATKCSPLWDSIKFLSIFSIPVCPPDQGSTAVLVLSIRPYFSSFSIDIPLAFLSKLKKTET